MEKVMNKSDVLSKLNEGTVTIVFEKTDTSERTISATLNSDYVTYDKRPGQSGDNSQSNNAQPVWDTDARGWRSFRWNSVRSVDGQETPGGILS
jgi:hypothetical protein